MAHNFKITPATGAGVRYISNIDGDDLNDGQIPDTSVKTIGNITTTLIRIIGSGQYEQGATISHSDTYIDGYVKILLTNQFIIRSVGGVPLSLNTQGNNYLYIEGSNSFEFRINYANGSTKTLSNVIIHDTLFVVDNSTGGSINNNNFNSCVIDSSATFSNTFNVRLNFDKSVLLVNLSLANQDGNTVSGCYLGAGYDINYGAFTPNFTNCCINGTITVNGVQYTLKQDRNGNAINGGDGFADVIAVYPNVYTNGNFSQDPEFINLSGGDYFSVADTSPLIRGAVNGNIGNTSRSLASVSALDTEFQSPVQSEDIVTSGNGLILDPASVDGKGTITSQPIQTSTNFQVIKRINFQSAYDFDGNEPVGSVKNQNTLATTVYGTGTAGRNPQRLTYEMRWSTQDSQPTIDSEWDNQSYLPAGDFAVFEVNSFPRIDSNGLGNGAVNFNVSTNAPVIAKWVQFRLTINEGL